MRAYSGGGRMGVAELGVAVFFGGVGFILADGVDRFLATYNPSATTPPPSNKFTSTGAGTLGNLLNVAARPNMYRLGAGGAMTALPILGAYAARRHAMLRSAFEGAAVGAGIKFFSMLWSNVIMPLFTPKDTSTGSLQKSVIARLYPAEIAAHINLAASQTSVASAGSGALSAPPQMGVGAPADVGPFAGVGVAGDSPYPNAEQALRSAAGLSEFPTIAQAMGTGGPGSDYPTATQAMRAATGIVGANPYSPGPPPGQGPGPRATPHTDPACGCIGDDPSIGFAGILAGAPEEEPVFDFSP